MNVNFPQPKGNYALAHLPDTDDDDAGEVYAPVWLLAAYDDGSAVLFDGYAGGRHPQGAWGVVWLRFVDANGVETVQEFAPTGPRETGHPQRLQ